MNKIFSIAWREFAATVFTKGFIMGIVMTPVMLAIVAGAITLMKKQKGPQIVGSVAIIDRSNLLESRIISNFSDDAVKKELDADSERAKTIVKEATKGTNIDPNALPIGSMPTPPIEEAPLLSLEFLPADTKDDDAKKPLETAEVRRREAGRADVSRIALVVIEPSTVMGDEKGDYPNFKTFYADRLDFQVKDRIERRVARAVVDTRLANDKRIASTGLNSEQLRKIMGQPSADAMTVTVGGDKTDKGQLKMLVPMGFMMLLMMSVLTSSQYLLTSTVEEKSNRVMEVLLSAVSPMQLMTGKILGYMAVGLLVLFLYGSLGIAGLIAFALFDIIEPMQLVYLVIFFAIAYFLIASLMAAIGAAVNEMKEAQAMMAPVMVIVMIPWLTWFLIQRAPNSPLATTLSFIPGANPFVMMIRLCGSEPVPTWQIPVSIAVGIASVIAAGWAAGKVFRVGALMYGKPPNFKTLWRWIKMA